MFQAFRNQKRWLMLIAMILIIPAFVFIGINGYSRLNPDANAIAKIDGKGIQPEEFDQVKREYIENMRRQQGGTIDTSLFDTPEANAAILSNLATQRAIFAHLNHNYMNIGEADAINVIKNAAAFQKDGKFDPQLYENFLAARGKSDQQFVFELRRDLSREMLVNSVAQTVTVPQKVADNINTILREKRVVRTLVFDPSSYMDKVKITDEQMQKFYDANKDQFRAPETIDIEYVVMSPTTLKVTAQPSDEELKQFYEQNKSKYAVQESRRASHILISPNADEKDKAKADADAKAKAEKIFEEVKADPSKFAEVAKKESEDTGSAEYGGDLDFFTRGQMVEPFENAVFGANKGDVVGPVKSEFGYHIIHVTDIREAHTRSFDEVKPEIVTLWQNQQRQALFAENADNFSNMVYEQSDSLAPEVEKFGLELHKLDGLTQAGVDPNSPAAPFITKRVVEELFSADALQDKRNIQATEVASNTIVSARVTKHVAAHLRTFDEVKGDIKKMLELEEASKLAAAAGEAKLKDLLAKKDLAGFAKAQTVSRSNPDHQPFALIQAEMAVPAKSLPTFTGTTVEDGAYIISYIESSEAPAAHDEDSKQISNEALRVQSSGEEVAFNNALKNLYNLEILKKEFQFEPVKAMK